MSDKTQDYINSLVRNEKSRKNMEKFIESSNLLDSKGNPINLTGLTNYKLKKDEDNNE